MLVDKAKDNLVNGVLPFWMNLMDKEYGGFYGAIGYWQSKGKIVCLL